MTDVETALKIIDQETDEISKKERIPVSEIQGRILADQVKASSDFPEFDNSAMDGFAFRKADLDNGQNDFNVDFEIQPKDNVGGRLKPGKCAYITTGSAVPKGADFIIPMELITNKNDQTITVEKIPSRNSIRKQGEGYKKGEVLLREGKLLSPADIGVLKSNGYKEVVVFAKTRIAVQVTGDELDEKRNTNGPVLQSWLQQFPSVTVDTYPPISDNKTVMAARLNELLNTCDVIVTTGGVSAGAYDFVIPAFESLGAEFKIRKVRQKPGKPFSFGKMNKTLILALPGNPISAVFCAVFYLGRIIRLQNHLPPEQIVAVLLNDYATKENRDEFVLAHIKFDQAERQVATRSEIQSHLLHHLSSANCFVHFESGKEYKKGDAVPVIPIG